MTEAVDYSHFVRNSDDGVAMIDFAVENIVCADCIRKVEHVLRAMAGVEMARLNYTNRRLHVEWTKGSNDPAAFIESLRRIGYRAHPFSAAGVEDDEARQMKFLLRCLAVAGFGAMNVMLLSVSIWAGDATTITPETRDFFHWLSALIALPVASFASQPFIANAVRGLRANSLNMDVPISVAILLALGMSIYETVNHAKETYFDSAVTLLFFLLLGRVLDQAMRRKTRQIAGNLASLHMIMATRQDSDGSLTQVPAGALRRDDLVLVRMGERIPADGTLIQGAGDVDESLITGETRRRSVQVGASVYAGAMNFNGQLLVKVMNAGDDTLVGEVERLMENAMAAKAKVMRLADRAARVYAPVVHLTALATAVAWLVRGASVHDALIAAITVLIITCPCALALAVPAVQVAASGAMFRAGLLLHSGDAIERYAAVDTIVFDKTGTLTTPEPELVNRGDVPDDLYQLAGRLAQSSRHPLARAVARSGDFAAPFADAEEVAGAGVRATLDGETARLGSAAFCDACEQAEAAQRGDPDASALVVRRGDQVAVLLVRQALRADADETVALLKARGYAIAILSGDSPAAVGRVAAALQVEDWAGGLKPAEKVQRLSALAARGKKALMVGDGVNDAPALAEAYASMSPVSAADLVQATADAVFLGEELRPVAAGLAIARRARRLMRQNLGVSLVYNLVALPVAMLGFVTPLIASVAMSGSSLLVTLNALRARLRSLPPRSPPPPRRPMTLRSPTAMERSPTMERAT